ncbi:MAG: hypothetical protein L6Q93_12135 [Phycisphaerae bacterium]|nr:hypothetical protein [Phycisphaerae bacterium]
MNGTGPVTLKAGELDCQCGTTFCTTGKLTWKSVLVNNTPTQGQIFTSGNGVATFGLGNATPGCPACN